MQLTGKKISSHLQSELKKLSNTDCWLVNRRLEIVHSNFDLDRKSFLYNLFFGSTASIQKFLSESFSPLVESVKIAFKGDFNTQNVDGSRLFFVPFPKDDLVLVFLKRKKRENLLKNISEEKLIEDLITDAICKVDRNGIIIEAKDNQFLVFTEEKEGRSIYTFFNQNEAAKLQLIIKKVFENNKASRLKLMPILKGQKVFLNVTVIKSNNNEVVIVFRDDTDRKGAEFELNIKTKAVDHSPMGICILDFEERYFLYANQAYYNLTGFSAEQVVGGQISIFDEPYTSMFFVDDELNKKREIYNAAIENKERYEGEILCRRMNGELYWNHLISIPVFDDYSKNTIFVTLVRDITESKLNNERLMTAIIKTQEEERHRFSQDLHDGIGQYLLAAKMNVAALKNESIFSEDENIISMELIDKSLDLLKEAINETRNISHNLMSQTLKTYGLTYAINEMVLSYNKVQKFKIEFNQTIGSLRCEYDLEVGVYRIIQEMLNNAIKHSKAKKIDIGVYKKANKSLEIQFNDDGIGFDLNATLNQKDSGIGIKNIETRTLFLGGQFKLNSNKGQGTNFRISLPLNRTR